ncbi:site-specific integrase [Pseudomonas sp. PA27(2017)]|uniref:site-specific integrase n=1 Tax=Pseudomonas sp. PA27(2017) TaxID=1932112 RepID=UPI000967E182|nr:site-specific integrase [Pseudomonas sp. PA27(2017)]OLU30646.1 hypothetical protein BVH06_15565 [Pseudomonas sp. PA27(2017)]
MTATPTTTEPNALKYQPPNQYTFDMAKTAHSIINIPILEGPIGQSLPFLFLIDGELSLLTLAWTRCILLETEPSPSRLSKAVSAIGRFYDFYTLEKASTPVSEGQLTMLLRQFHEARRFGLPSLGWESVRKETAMADVRAISEFSDWCADNFGHVAANPVETSLITNLSLKDQMTAKFRSAARSKWNMLHHLYGSTAEGQGIVSQREFVPQAKKFKPTYTPEHFPPNKIWEAIGSCPSLRDKLFLILLFFGGLRISEPLHLFVTDVSVGADGVAIVVLGHPKDGQYKWVDRSGKNRRGNRQEFLKERYGIGPRNYLAENHPMHAGWKGMTADNGSKAESQVHWLRPDAGRLFAKLHSKYMKTERAHIPDNHPYYFANFQPGEFFGGPLKLSNASKSFYRAAKRAGLRTSNPGVNPHGARHFFGFYCASILQLSLERTNKIMHHASLQSTEIYYHLSMESVRKALKEAHEKQSAAEQEFMAPPVKLNDI